MTDRFLTDYFQVLAGSHPDIRHGDGNKAYFPVHSRYDLDAFDNSIKSMEGRICLLFEIGDGSLGEWDTPADSGTFGLHVLIKCSEDLDERAQARDTAKAILIDMITRIRYDRLEAGLRQDSTDGPLYVAGIQFDSAGKYSYIDAADDWFGRSLYLQLTDKQQDLSYKSSKWL